MKSTKRLKDLDEIVLPFKITFPVTVEGSINNENFLFPKGVEVTLTYPQYENLRHSSYEKYLN